MPAEAEPHGEGGASGGAPGAMERLVGLPSLEVVTEGVLHLRMTKEMGWGLK